MILDLKTVMFFKVPIPGQVKTRLIPALGAEGAATLAEAMALDCLHTAMAAGLTPEISVAGPMDHPFVTGLVSRGLKVSAQVDGDFGARMSAAMGPAPRWPSAATRRPCGSPSSRPSPGAAGM
jgi:glycosyltransferase A (GT-A) superfamily protein (DUF2064 family)